MKAARLGGLFFAFLSLAPVPPIASAQTPAAATALERLVRLRDGALFRGELVEEVPSDHLTLKLATGEIRRIAWADLAEVTPLVAPPAPPPAAPYPVMPQAPVAPPVLGPVVELSSDDASAGLYRLSAAGSVVVGWRQGVLEVWEPVCRAPCAVQVDHNGYYAIRGNGIVPSRPFNLPASGTVRLDVKAGHLGPRAGGLIMMSLGLGAALGGAVMMATSQTFAPQGPMDPAFATIDQMERQTAQTMLIAGGVMVGVGVPLAVGGIVLMVKSRTHVTIDGEQLALKLPGKKLALSATGLHF
jgi:hypothetical protein